MLKTKSYDQFKDMLSNYINNMTLISFTTTQINAFRIAFESIESLVSDVLFVFSADGIHIRDIDKTGNLLVSASFEASKFDTYTFGNDETQLTKYKIGVAVDTIVKAVKCNLPYDILTCEIQDYSGNPISMVITLTSTKRDEKKICPIKITDVVSTNNDISPMEYDTTIEVNPTILTKYIKDINHVAETVCMNVCSSCMELIGTVTVKGKTTPSVIYKLKNGTTININTGDKVESKTISVKRLLLLNKCVNLSPIITIHLQESKPLVFVLPMASLGVLKLLYV